MKRRDFLGMSLAAAVETGPSPVSNRMSLADPANVVVRGLAGDALAASLEGRLKHFIESEESQPVAMFGPQPRSRNTKADWYGEHAGKWLYTAARAAYRTHDGVLKARVLRVADFLARRQGPDGYLGTYAPGTRFSDDAWYRNKTWDIWVHSYVIAGLLEVNRFWPGARYLDAAKKIGELCLRTFTKGGKSVAYMGNHAGLSGTVLLEPAVDLYATTGEKRFLDLARLVLKQAEERPELRFLSNATNDLQTVGDGKIYQLLWNFVGLAKLYRATGDSAFPRILEHAWRNTREQHLTLGGGPWGGIAGHHEVFDRAGFFSPNGYVETCSTMSWIQLNRELLQLTGEARFAEEIEKALYNDLIGAADPDGENWCYFVFPNGKRENTYTWACCKSSGAMALEEIPALVAGEMGGGVALNLYAPGSVACKRVKLAVNTAYPCEGRIEIRVQTEHAARFPLYLRIPSWVKDATLSINGRPAGVEAPSGSYVRLEREWRSGDRVVLDLPMRIVIHRNSNYLAATRGPLVYAAQREEALRVPPEGVEKLFTPADPPADLRGPAFALRLPHREPILFAPYYEADRRKDGNWRLTWMQADAPIECP